MSRLNKFKEKQKQLSRFQALKSIFSSLLMTVSVVVIATVVIPKSPKASIQSIETFNHTVSYTVEVTDSDSAIIEGTLKAVLENQFDRFEKELTLGRNIGYFEALERDQTYQLKIVADKGFGLEVLAKSTIHTEPKAGGIILGVSDPVENGEYLDYDLTYLIHDPFDEYKQIQIRYGFLYEGEEEVFHYQTVLLEDEEGTFTLSDVYRSNMIVEVYLEAITQLDVTIVLDEIEFSTPFTIYGFIEPISISKDSVTFSIYSEMMSDLEITYEVLLKQHGYVVQRQQLEAPSHDGEFHHEGMTITFDGLNHANEYTYELMAKFINPYTLEDEEVLVNESLFTTLEDYEIITVDVVEMEDSYGVNIMINDPLNQFDRAGYTTYEIVDDMTWYDGSELFSYTVDGDYKTFLFTIPKPMIDHYKIEIVLKNQMYYEHQEILYIVTHTEEV